MALPHDLRTTTVVSLKVHPTPQMTGPPTVLRIKRKRAQDPLQALILESHLAKRSKPLSPASSRPESPQLERKSWFFELSRTDANALFDADSLTSVLSESANSAKGREFVIPKQREEPEEVNHELTDMVNAFLQQDQPKVERKKRSRAAVKGTEDEYVYDVYQLSTLEPLTNHNFPQSQIGYIRFFDDADYDLMQSDDEVKSDVASDDEDSNAESFYQNDYPEDEDAGALSETYESEDELEETMAKLNIDHEAEFDNLYSDFFDGDGEQQRELLDSEGYERQRFFAADDNDDLAKYRDRIFGQLQTMIKESE